MKVRKVYIEEELENLLPNGSYAVRHVLPVCNYCKYFGKECPTYVDEHGYKPPSCNAFGLNTFFISDEAKFDEDGFCDLVVSANHVYSEQSTTLDVMETCKSNPTDLCTQLLRTQENL